MSIVLWTQEVVFTHVIVDWDRFMQMMYLGRAPRTKETLLDFLKWRRVTRHPLVFRGLTGSQRTPGFWGITAYPPGHSFCHPVAYRGDPAICDCSSSDYWCF